MGDLNKDELLELIEELTDLYYQNRVKESGEKLTTLVKELSAVASLLPIEKQQEYLIMMKSFMEAMELKDFVMMADILTFDILEAMQSYDI